MKKIVKVILIIIGVYLASNFILKNLNVCPKYIDLMPRVITHEFKIDWREGVCNLVFRPLTPKVY